MYPYSIDAYMDNPKRSIKNALMCFKHFHRGYKINEHGTLWIFKNCTQTLVLQRKIKIRKRMIEREKTLLKISFVLHPWLHMMLQSRNISTSWRFCMCSHISKKKNGNQLKINKTEAALKEIYDRDNDKVYGVYANGTSNDVYYVHCIWYAFVVEFGENGRMVWFGRIIDAFWKDEIR